LHKSLVNQISSNKNEILNFLFTQGNVDDREPLNDKNFHDKNSFFPKKHALNLEIIDKEQIRTFA